MSAGSVEKKLEMFKKNTKRRNWRQTAEERDGQGRLVCAHGLGWALDA
jgi:hypothetical protein